MLTEHMLGNILISDEQRSIFLALTEHTAKTRDIKILVFENIKQRITAIVSLQ